MCPRFADHCKGLTLHVNRGYRVCKGKILALYVGDQVEHLLTMAKYFPIYAPPNNCGGLGSGSTCGEKQQMVKIQLTSVQITQISTLSDMTSLGQIPSRDEEGALKDIW